MVERLVAGSKLGDFELIKSLGQGGMAEVFLAKQSGISGFQRLVALKVIHPSHAEDATFIESLIQEAKVAVQLSHPNIAQVHDLGKVDNVYFIVMDFIDGKDLYRLLFESSHQGQKIPTEIALFIAEQIASGLHYCHERKDHYGRPMNLVHRDVSPQNVYLSWQGDVKILDFGIAKVSHRLRHTEAGVIKGKLQYMSPEQVTGESLDARSDLFSCGICLFEMLAGEMARSDADPLDLLDKIRRAEFKSLGVIRPDLDGRIIDLVEKSLCLDREERFQSGAEFSRAILRLRFELYPEFNPGDLGRYLLSIFGDTPFYLEDSQPSITTLHEEFGELSVSISSSVIFGESDHGATSRTDDNSIIGDDTVDIDRDSLEDDGGESVVEDTFVGSRSTLLDDGHNSVLDGSSMERTNLFEAPRLDRANPFSDPSTNSHFGHMSPAAKADPVRAPHKDEGGKVAATASESVHTDGVPGQQQDNSHKQSKGTVGKSKSTLEEFGGAADGDNPFDASIQMEVEAASKTGFRVLSLEPFKRISARLSRGDTSSKITLGVLAVLLVYFCFFLLPSSLGNSGPDVLTVQLNTVPPGAQIYVNGQDTKRVTDTDISVPVKGSTSILITLEGYQPEEIEMNREAKQKVEGGTVTRTLTLVKQ